MSTGQRQGGRRARGQSLVEFALASPLFFLVFLGIAEGGYFVVASTIVSHATHEGARLGVLATTTREDLKDRVTDAAQPVATVAAADITVCINGTAACALADYDGRAAGDRLYVHTAYTHRPLVSYVFAALTWRADAEAELWVEEDMGP